MKILFQSDDFGITEGVTLGIIKGIEKGIIRNTGLFTNMKSSEFAASFIPKYPQCCFGIDINLVAGKPLTDPAKVPGLVDENGVFIKSIKRFEDNKVIGKKGVTTLVFENDPYVYEEVYLEVENQILRFIELVGKKPEYIMPHSLVTPTTYKAIKTLADKYEVPYAIDVLVDQDVTRLPGVWNIKPVFEVEAQLHTNVEQNVLKLLKENLHHEKAFFVFHAGYVDADLLEVSSYSLIRARDLEMATSKELLQFIEDNKIELITYRDLLKWKLIILNKFI